MTMLSNPPREHHRLPRWYLRRFAADSSRTLVVGPDGERKLASIKRATVVTDYYALEYPDGSLDQSVEVAIGPSESAGADVCRSMLAGRFPPSDADRLEFAGFLALQTVRGAMFRRAWEELAAAAGKTPSRNATMRTTLDQLPQLANVLLRMRWRLNQSERPIFFTGDQPVVYWRRGASPRFFDGIGPMTAEEIRFVLDPQHVLVLTWRGNEQDERTFRLGEAEATAMNVFLARWCEYELYCQPDLEHYLPDIRPAPLPSSADPQEAEEVVAELKRLGNWREAALVASSRGWGDQVEGYGAQRGRRLRF
jgi:hypothetical protein